MSLYLSRVDLIRNTGSTGNLAALLDALDPGDASHRLIWTLFADDGARARDFLYRSEAGPGAGPPFIILSKRPPGDPHAIWQIETKPFDPKLKAGDRLHFQLRANPVIQDRAPAPGRKRGPRHDVVMHHLTQHGSGKGPARADERADAIETAGRSWLAGRAARHGFTLCDDPPLRIEGYLRHELPRKNGGAEPMAFSTLEFEGQLTVTDPAAFIAMLGRGLGRARAFGNGLMLIRRA